MTTKIQSVKLTLRWDLDPEYPGRLLSRQRVYVNASMLVCFWAFRVKNDEQGCQVAWSDEFAVEVEAVQSLAGGSAVNTFNVPGLEGDWILAATAL